MTASMDENFQVPILVLGGTGFVGQKLLSALCSELRYKVYWTARISSAPGLHERFVGLSPPILIDDHENLDLELLKSIKVIIDLVSRGRGRFSGVRDIVGRIRAHGRLIDELYNRNWAGHYIYLSSGGTIYGAQPPAVCTEATPVAPASDYALEKAFIEMHLQSISPYTGMQLSILRIANAYGEGQPAKPGFGVIPAILSSICENRPFGIYGTGLSQRDYVHVDDVVRAIVAALHHGGAGILNIGSGIGTSVCDLLALIEKRIGRPIQIKPGPVFSAEPESIVLDVANAKKRLNWVPRIHLDVGLERVLDRYGL